MGLNIAEKALLKSLEAQEKSGVLDLKPGAKEQLEELREKQLDDQSGLFDRIGLFSTAQASEINPNNPPSMLPTGAMDRETPFGDMLKPEVPRGGSIFSNREFGDITAGASVGQRYNVDNPELFFNTAEGQAPAEEEKNFFDYLQGLSGGVVDFAKDIAGRSFASQALGAGAGTVFGPFGALAGGIFGALKGGDLFNAPYIGADSSITGTPLAQFAFRNELRRDPSFNIGAALDRQNALGGYYSDFARGQRNLANRFSNLLDRARSGKNFSTRNLLGISNALGMGVTRDDINNIVSGAYDLNTGDGPSGAGTFTAESLSRGFDSEEGPSTSSSYEDFDTTYAKGGIVSL